MRRAFDLDVLVYPRDSGPLMPISVLIDWSERLPMARGLDEVEPSRAYDHEERDAT